MALPGGPALLAVLALGAGAALREADGTTDDFLAAEEMDMAVVMLQSKTRLNAEARLRQPSQSQDIPCPGSATAEAHAWAQVTVLANARCADAIDEMVARASHQGGWEDPHNNGTYSVLSEGNLTLLTQRLTNPKTSVGNVTYTDKQLFTFVDAAEGNCTILACSESQGPSDLDFSTNYCNIHNLYCDAEGCNPVLHAFSSTEQTVLLSSGATQDLAQCDTGYGDAAAV